MALSATAIIDAGAVDADAPSAIPPAGPPEFTLVATDVDGVVSHLDAVFPLENGLVIGRHNRLVPLDGPMLNLSSERLHAGLPQDQFALTARITGLTGRFPEAAFLAVATNNSWGGGQIYRFDVDRWVLVKGSEHQSGFLAGVGVSTGPAIVIQRQDFVGEQTGPQLLMPLTGPPYPRDLLRIAVKTEALSTGFVASLPSGHLFFSGVQSEGVSGVVEHFVPGSRVPVIRRLPPFFYPESAFARSPSDAYVVGSGDTHGNFYDPREPRFAHFDGRAWTLQPPPPTHETLTSVAALADGSVYVTSSEEVLWRRSPEGAWAEVTPRLRAGGLAPLPESVFVSAGGELHVIAEEDHRTVLLVQKSGPRLEPPVQPDDESLASCKTLFLVIAPIQLPYMGEFSRPPKVRRWLDMVPEGRALPLVEALQINQDGYDTRYLGVVLPDLALGKRLIASPLPQPVPTGATLRVVCYQP